MSLGIFPEDYLKASAYREISSADAGLKYPLLPEGLFYAPGNTQAIPTECIQKCLCIAQLP